MNSHELLVDTDDFTFNEKLKSIPSHYKQNLIDMRTKGYTIFKKVISDDKCNNYINDFENYVNFKDKNNEYFNNKRWVAGHLLNDNSKSIALNKHVLEFLDIIFNREAVVYSSLTFWKGTQQAIHRDTPHFYTNPVDLYFGCWYALEDINPDSGPLFYWEGGHKLSIPSGKEIYLNELSKNKIIDNNMPSGNNSVNISCLETYTKLLEEICKKEIPNNYREAVIEKGDCVVWHPKLPHGGSQILNTKLFRRSMVTHNVPINKGVCASLEYFSDKISNRYKANVDFKLKYSLYDDRKYFPCHSNEGKPQIQTSYT